MQRLTILLASILMMTLAATQFVNAQVNKPSPWHNLEVKPPNKTGCEMPLLRNLKGREFTMSVETAGPIKITQDEIDRINKYDRFLKELNEWHLEGIKVAERLEEEDKLFPTTTKEGAKDVTTAAKTHARSQIRSWRTQLATMQATRFQFPKSVVDEMRPAPEPVTAPAPTQANLRLKFTNNSFRDVVINEDIFCDVSRIKISVSGAAVLQIPRSNVAQTADYRTGKYITVKPGKSHQIKLERLRFGRRGLEGICLRNPGKHTISVQYHGVVKEPGVDKCTTPKPGIMFASVEVLVEETWKEQQLN
ncbi:MAG: hypothetical protein AB8B55_13250 [Mariniblastus sp.]